MRLVRETLPSAEPRHAVTESVIVRAFTASYFSFVFAIAGRCTVIRVTPLHDPYDSLVFVSRPVPGCEL
jgi:hypothetical protein